MPHITFVHGISNKPAPPELHSLWLRALARDNGLDCDAEGITSSMVYWADVMYAAPDPNVEQLEAANELLEAQREAAPGTEAEATEWRQELPADERAFVDALAEQIGADLPDEAAPPTETTRGKAAVEPGTLTKKEMEAIAVLERVPLPWFIKRPIMKLLLRDVHHYLFNTTYAPRPGSSFEVQKEIRRRFVDAVKQGAGTSGPHIVISHSMGTVVAYDCLKRVGECPEVSALFTIGSPLGLDEIQDKLKPEWSRGDGFPQKVRGPWINVYDPLDPVVGFDPKFGNDYLRGNKPAVEDIKEENWGKWRHSITKYLNGPKLRDRLGQLLS